MAVLAHCVDSSSAQAHHIESAFRHYLIARQLNDDLHDWYEDVQAGQASYVVTAILRDMHVTPGIYNVTILLSDMQKRFMRTTMEHMCELTLHHIHHAQHSFAKSQLLQPANEIYGSLNKLELSVQHSLDRHAKARALIKM